MEQPLLVVMVVMELPRLSLDHLKLMLEAVVVLLTLLVHKVREALVEAVLEQLQHLQPLQMVLMDLQILGAAAEEQQAFLQAEPAAQASSS
jgi:hypothetical protein